MTAYALYEPVNTLKPVADDVWVVDGPEIRMGYPYLPFFKIPFPTRMTIVRLGDGMLWVHSPTPLPENLAHAVDALGRVAYLVAPNLLHYSWVGDWKARYPEARAYAAPGVRAKAAGRFAGFDADLGETPPVEWQDAFAQVLVPGSYLTEAVFLHKASRTLILTDLIENFERSKLPGVFLRLLTRLGGVQDPDGQMPRDMRLTYRRHSKEMRAAVEKMIGWGPERIILAHGRWYDRDGAAELRRAFRWLLQ